MNTKQCFKCNTIKSLNEFYKHKKMPDGHLNKCKICTKEDVRQREEKLKLNPDWVIKEKERHRLKYHRLNYKDKHKPSKKSKKIIMSKHYLKYPEKRKARNYSSKLSKIKGIEQHHWSYNKEHYKDVIELSIKDHAFIHRYLIYDQEKMMYKTLEGVLLNTKELHLEYITNKLN